MNTCPIQIIDDKTHPNHRWITFDKHIHRNGKKYGLLGTYDNIVGYCRGSAYDMGLIRGLVSGRSKSNIYESDIIRNPTLEELKEINAILKKSGYRLNLKTYQLVKKI